MLMTVECCVDQPENIIKKQNTQIVHLKWTLNLSPIVWSLVSHIKLERKKSLYLIWTPNFESYTS